jgi:hypothetical protein
MRKLILALMFVLFVTVPNRVAALTVEVRSGDPGTIISTLSSAINDPENGSKKTIFLSNLPTGGLNSTTSQCILGAAKTYGPFTFSDLTTPVATTVCASGKKAVRARVYIDKSNASAPKMVFLGKVTANFTGTSATLTVRANSSAGAGDYTATSVALVGGTASKGVFRRSGPLTISAPSNNTVKVTTRFNPTAASPNVVNNPSPTAPSNSLSTADPPSASIPPSPFVSGSTTCTNVGTVRNCQAAFDIADTESNISCSGTCPSIQTDWTFGFFRTMDSMEKTGSGVTAFSQSLPAVLGALEQCNLWESNPSALGTRIEFLEPTNGSSGTGAITGKAFALESGGDFFLAAPLSGFYVTVPGSSVNDNESVVGVVPARVTLNDDKQKVCNPVTLVDFASLQATYAFEQGACAKSSFRFEMLFENGQTARGMFGDKQGNFFSDCTSTEQNFVTSTEKNWQLDGGPFITFADLRDTVTANITSLRLVLDRGLDKQPVGFQLVDLDQVSFQLTGANPVVFAPPPAGQETPIEDLPRASAVVTKLSTDQTFVVQEANVNINNQQWVFQVTSKSLFGPGLYEMRMCLAQLCPDDPVLFTLVK